MNNNFYFPNSHGPDSGPFFLIRTFGSVGEIIPQQNTNVDSICLFSYDLFML